MITKQHGVPGAAVIALTAALAWPGAAQAATPTTPSAWTAYSAAPAWVNPTDNLQWYVASQPITSAMVNKTITITVDSTGAIDCSALGFGYAGSTGWVALSPKSGSCGGPTASETFTVTKAMVGKRLTVNGWSAVGPVTTATVQGTTSVGGTVLRTSSTAEKPAPTETRTQIGTWGSTPVYLVATAAGNTIVVGDGASATQYQTLSGTPFHAGVTDGRVDVWTASAADQTVSQWHLDLATGSATTSTMAGTVNLSSPASIGKPGFWMSVSGPLPLQLMDWGGTVRYSGGVLDPRVRVGFTDTAAVVQNGGMNPNEVWLIPLDGSPITRAVTAGTIWNQTIDATGTSFDVHSMPQAPDQHCRLEQGWATAQCTQI